MFAARRDSSDVVPGRRWRECLWLPGAMLVGRDRDEQARLWLLLDDGCVPVFHLAGAVLNDALLDLLAQSVTDDARGDLVDIRPDALLAFHSCLNGVVLASLAVMAGANTFWASARNYNRLAIHPWRREPQRCSRTKPSGDLPRYRLAQLRGPNNEPVFEAMKAFARRVAREMNAPSNAERRGLARQAVRDAEKKPQPPVPEFDDECIAALPSLLALSPRSALDRAVTMFRKQVSERPRHCRHSGCGTIGHYPMLYAP